MMSNVAAAPAGVYVHWPFCERKCPYCDFYTFGREHPNIGFEKQYLERLIAEINSASERIPDFEKQTADTIYFGGGTPSLMGPEAFGFILAELNRQFEIADTAEITLEVNPTTAETAQLERMLRLGVNRLSVGSQSFNDRILKELGRVHDAATTRRAIAHMREIGAFNISLDLIFAAPRQTLDDLKRDMEAIFYFSPEHVSVYGMTIHSGTPFARWQGEGKLVLPPEDDYAAMYELIIETLGKAGYEQYEISNWSKPGRESRHNIKYWKDVNIAAFGVSAHGVWNGRRYENSRDLKGYLAGDAGVIGNAIEPAASERGRYGEIMMLALRRVRGVDWREINQWSRTDLRRYYGPELNALKGRGLVEYDDRAVRLTREGLLLADTAVAEFF